MQRIRTDVRKKLIISALIFIAVIALDQISKALISNGKTNAELIKGLLSFRYTQNTGAAFSFLHDKSWAQAFFLIISAAAIAAFTAYFVLSLKNGNMLTYALVFIISGAVGNFIDRLINRFVVDFISISFFPAIFNVADIALTAGAVMFVAHFLFLDKDAVFKKKQKK